MCGIFGITITKKSSLKQFYPELLKSLFLLSESRGKEASGFAINNGSELRFLKTPFPASDLVKSNVFDREVNDLLNSKNNYYTAIGHSRLVTDGYEQFNENNQPVIRNDMAVIHNGIIVNSKELWEKFPDETRKTDLDSELIPTLLRKFYNQKGSLQQSLYYMYKEIYGMTSIAVLPCDLENLILSTNNGSLYIMPSDSDEVFIFASERYILNSFIEKHKLENIFSKQNIKQIPANHAGVLKLEDVSFEVLGLTDVVTDFRNIVKRDQLLSVAEVKGKVSGKSVHINTSMEYSKVTFPKEFTAEVEKRRLSITELIRCKKCILPSTFPFIEFDENGVCNYCNNYSKLKFKGLDEFRELLAGYRNPDKNAPNCLMPFSGGRDSSYALHVVKRELGMNPLAFSYDWGMLTDLARRNQARMCGELGVEHILVSADIRKKRNNIRKNVLAWLKRPSLGTIPLFMAGDKQYFYYANLLMKQNNLDLSILGENMLETTMFKTGFCGIKPVFNGQKTYSLSMGNKLEMLLFYGKEYLLNPSYINSSILDTVDSFKSYYIIEHRNVNIFDYITWEEERIESILINEYDWETDPGTKTTWRIGDGTAAFYNYIYFMVAGFSENDTFRSNQIREGQISREEALVRSREENNPRWDSLKWYCSTINVDFENTIRVINKIPPRY